MEWMVGESPTDLFSVSAGDVSVDSERQKVDAKRRLLDLVCKHDCSYNNTSFTLCNTLSDLVYLIFL